jgi:outer membrane protein
MLFERAIRSDPATKGAVAQLTAAQERVVQARAAFGPVAVLTATGSDTRYREWPLYELRGFRNEQFNLQVTQPLFRNTLHAGLQVALAQSEQAQIAVIQTRAEAGQRLVESVFDLLKARDSVRQLSAQRQAVTEQLASARRAFQIGTAAITDPREAEAKADFVAAQLAAAEQELDLRQQVIRELTGEDAAPMLDLGMRADALPKVPATSVLEWLGSAQAANPAVQQAQRALQAAEAELSKAWQGHAPTADLTYNYSRSRDSGTVTSLFPRRGDTSAIGVNFNVPLFAGGATQSRVREAMALRDKAKSDVDAATRNAMLGVRQSFSATLAALGQAHALQTAVGSQTLSLRVNRRGYEVGMKVNAEVLEAQSRLFEAQRDLSRAQYDAWVAYFKLLVLSGQNLLTEVERLQALLLPLSADAPLPPKRGAAEAVP